MLQTLALPVNVSKAALNNLASKKNQISHHWIFSCEDV